MAPNNIVKLKSRKLKKGSLEPQNVITSRKSNGDIGRKVEQVLKKVEFKRKEKKKVWEAGENSKNSLGGPRPDREGHCRELGKTEGNIKHDRINT